MASKNQDNQVLQNKQDKVKRTEIEVTEMSHNLSRAINSDEPAGDLETGANLAKVFKRTKSSESNSSVKNWFCCL